MAGEKASRNKGNGFTMSCNPQAAAVACAATQENPSQEKAFRGRNRIIYTMYSGIGNLCSSQDCARSSTGKNAGAAGNRLQEETKLHNVLCGG